MLQTVRVKKLTMGLVIGLLGSMLTYSDAYGQSYVYPLKVSDSKRYLVDQNDKPFFWSGEAAWSLAVQVSKGDAVYYLEDRKQKGFNVLGVSLIHKFSSNPPANHYGDLPFTGRTFTTPNEDYFAHVDYVINEAAQRGIVIALVPLFLGADSYCASQGWCNEVRAASLSDMRTWGRYVGNRYKDFDN
ncbi:MAG: apiosidase-like domain-containing protein, partial [Planctomycetota bacterium]